MEDKNAPPGGALFPRLHVKETKNAGPRAPPRNKMALYEQFTVPSHRCQQQQSDGAPPQPFVPQALNGGYYFPYYMVPSPVAFQPMNVVLGQHSQSVANETEQRELQQVPGDGSSNRQLARIPSLHSRARSGKTKTGAPRVDDVAAVPTYPSKPAAVPARSSKQELFASASVAPSNASTSATKSQRQVEVRETTQARKDSRPRNRAPGDLGDQENGSEVRVMASSSPSHSYESNEDNGRIDNQSDEELEGRGSPEEVEASDDSATSVVENNAAPSAITSKEIMSAVGDEEFWKMRKAMQRQQTIFQKQLFELHRLTKVQHLMANSKISDPSKTQDEKTDKRVGSEPTHCGEAPKTSKPDPKPDQAPAPKTPSQTQPLSTTPYDYTTHPRPIQAANTINYATYHPAYNQWYAPLPFQFPFQQTFPVTAQVFNTPYYPAPLYGGGAAPPFLPPPPDPRQFMSPPVQLQPWPQQPPPGSLYSDPAALQWMGFVNPPGGATYRPPAAESSLQASSIHDDHQSRKDRGIHLRSQGSSSGFSLIQRADSSSPAPAPAPSPAAENRRQQHQEPRQKLVGRFCGENQSGGQSEHGVSPYSRPSGFQSVKNSSSSSKEQRSSQGSHKAIKVTPRAAPVTAESAAEILHSIQKERPS
ncbi:ELF3-like protein 2 isoform X1 [Selaginella moellendorffii]|uniref:ELF3-like protein 2 isoform X1 n=1 Tax=Selaginella moellendorffii TaxID=88036 RepID=UPI000D1CAC50|nr:ELF3-like protein 2 isoform X1 [Selaginella moellendorffii]|eukprot:XP_024538139.1 ELF3-like protein 2 isoform X1 [Selaginella moellendorffii]